MTRSTIVYRPNGDNSVLRYSLWTVWGKKCYWCNRALSDSTYADIDHVIPQSDFYEARILAGLPESFELHAVENLAPICSSGPKCNQRKPEDIAPILGFILNALELAARRAEAVRTAAFRIQTARGAEAGLLKFITSDIDDQIRGLGNEYGPQLLQRLYAIVPEHMEKYFSSIDVVIEHPALVTPEPDFPAVSSARPGDPPTVPLTLGRNGRFALEAAERLYDVRVVDCLSEPLSVLLDEISQQVEETVPIDDQDYDARSPLALHSAPVIDLECDECVFDDGLTIPIRLTVHADFETSTAVTDSQASVVSGQFEVFTVAQADIRVTVTDSGAAFQPTLVSFVIDDSIHTY